MIEQFTKNKLLSEVSTLGIGGPAAYYTEVKRIEEMQDLLAYCSRSSLDFFILGKGSNCLFCTKGLNRVVIHNKIDFCKELEPGLFHVGTGYSFSLLGMQTAKKGWTGLEFASGIPASVGGAVYMNAGAQAMQTWTTLESVDFVSTTGDMRRYMRDELSFGYRFSQFQQMKGAIVSATFRLQQASNARARQLELLDARIKTQPYQDKSAGCVFKNPKEIAAGMLIDRAGLKGFQIGGAKVSEMHANFLVNASGATSDDFCALIQHIKKVVYDTSGHELETEVFYIRDDQV
jgi:UDP-N-acetylmuramate dehydrogenase